MQRTHIQLEVQIKQPLNSERTFQQPSMMDPFPQFCFIVQKLSLISRPHESQFPRYCPLGWVVNAAERSHHDAGTLLTACLPPSFSLSQPAYHKFPPLSLHPGGQSLPFIRGFPDPESSGHENAGPLLSPAQKHSKIITNKANKVIKPEASSITLFVSTSTVYECPCRNILPTELSGTEAIMWKKKPVLWFIFKYCTIPVKKYPSHAQFAKTFMLVFTVLHLVVWFVYLFIFLYILEWIWRQLPVLPYSEKKQLKDWRASK